LLWPGYYADPASAPPMPSFIRISGQAYGATIASVVEQLAGGFSEKLREVRVPAVFVLGAASPMPVSQGQQTAELMPGGEVQVVPGAGHLPWHEQPGCVARALTRVSEAISSA
jgi:pimeloyl-ACP methyl ester carboxylesterase